MTPSVLDPRALPPLLTTCQAAEALQLHVNTVKKLCRTGKLPAFKAGAVWRIQRADLLAFMQAGAHPAASGSQLQAVTELATLPQHQQRFALLHEIDRAILAAQSPAEIARAAADAVLRATDAARVVVALWQAQGDTLEVLAAAGSDHPPLEPGARLAVLPWPWFPAVRRGQVGFVDDLAQVSDLFPAAQAAVAEGIRSQVVIPLLVGGRPIGHLALSRRSAGRLPDDDLALAQQVTDSLAIAIHHAGLLEAEQRARQELETLQAANFSLTQSLDLHAVLEGLLDFLGQLVPYDSANVMLLTSDDWVAVSALRGYERWTDPALTRNIRFNSHANTAIQAMFASGQSLLVPDTAQYPGWEHPPGAEHVRSWLAVPLVVNGRVLGLFSVDKVEAGFFRPEHLRLAEALASQAAVAIQNAQLYAEVHDRRHQLQSLSRRLVEVQEQERRALSRDLHDTSGQSITALKLGLGALKRADDCSEALKPRIDELLQLTETVAVDLHRLAVNLRPASLDGYGLIPALEQLLTEFRKQTGVAVAFLAEGLDDERLPAGTETALYRIVQEATTNVARYAQASNISVMVQRDGDRVQVIVEDDGRGFDVAEALRSGRLGLLGMRERAEMLDGTLEVESSPGAGATVYVTVPARLTEGLGSQADVESPVALESAPPAPAPAPATAGSAPAPDDRLVEAAELARGKVLSDTLVDITAATARCANADEILRLVLALSAFAIGRDNAHIALRAGDGWELRYGYPESPVPQRFADSEAPAFVWVERTRRVLVVDDTGVPDLDEELRLTELGVKSFASIPLLAGDRLLGVLSFVNHGVTAPFHASEVEFLNRLASLAALALDNVQLHESEIRQRDELAWRVEELEAANHELEVATEELQVQAEELSGANAEVSEAAEQLRRSDATYRAIARNFPNGAIYVFDHELRYLVVEGELLPLFGQTPESMEGKTIWEALDAVTAGRIELRYRRTLAGEAQHFETFYGEPFGNRTLASDYRPIRDGSARGDGGRVVCGLLVVRDISEHKRMVVELAQREMVLRRQAERLTAQNAELQKLAADVRQLNAELELRVAERTAELRQKEAELEAVFASLPDAVYVGNANGITRCNQAALDYLGCDSLQELQDQIPNLAAKLNNRFAANGERVPNDQEVFVQALQGRPAVLEMIQRNLKTGRDIFVRSAAAPIRVGSQVSGAVALNTDITERVLAEQAIRQQSQRLEILHEIDDTILAARAPAEIARAAIDRALEMAQAERVTVVLCDFAAGTGEILAAAGAGSQGYPTGARVPLSLYRMIEQVKDGHAATIEDFAALPDDWPAKEATLAAGIRSACFVPLLLGHDVIGVLTVNRSEAGPLPPEIMELMAHVADSLAVAIYNARLHHELEISREELRALARRLVDVQERERRYVADQLYNQTAQVLAAAKLHLGTLKQALGRDPDAVQRLHEIQGMLDGAIRELHDLATGLHPAALDRPGLAAALQQYVAEFGKLYGLQSSTGTQNMEGSRVPAEVETALYRIVQEALANVAQHSAATHVAVMLSRFEDALTLIIEDDGRGFDPGALDQQTGLGLAAIRERAQSVGGVLTIETKPGTGTTILVNVPL